MGDKESISALYEMLGEAQQNANFHMEMVREELAGNGLDLDKVLNVLNETNREPLPKEDEVSAEEFDTAVDAFIQKVTLEGKEDLVKTSIETYAEPEETESEDTQEASDSPKIKTGNQKVDWIRYMLSSAIDVLKTKDSISEIEKEADESTRMYSEKITSKQYDKVVETNIETWKNTLARVEAIDSYDARKYAKELRHNIYVMEHRYDVEFLFARIDSPKLHKKEKESIIRSFLSYQTSEAMMAKFKAATKRFGLNPDTYKYLFNLEENFLEPEYHPFNNLFLMIVMRYIGYCDEKQEQDVKILINDLVKLVHHKFYSLEVRDIFLNSVRNMLKNFFDSAELFKEKNITAPGSENRKKREESYKKRDESMIKRADEDIRKAIELYNKYSDRIELDDEMKKLVDVFEKRVSPGDAGDQNLVIEYLKKLQLSEISNYRDIAVAFRKEIDFQLEEEKEKTLKKVRENIQKVTERYVKAHPEVDGAAFSEKLQTYSGLDINKVAAIEDDETFLEKVDYLISRNDAKVQDNESDVEEQGVEADTTQDVENVENTSEGEDDA